MTNEKTTFTDEHNLSMLYGVYLYSEMEVEVYVSLQALRAFEAAARRGSFKIAAEELSVTPTAISHHIHNLETRLNVDLFHRKVRGVTLTETGKRLAKATFDGFREIEIALEEIKMAGGTLRVTTTSSLAAMILIPSLQDFAKTNPNTSVEISTGESVDSRFYTIPIRFGDTTTVASSDIIRYESFDLFGAHGMEPPSWSAETITLFTTEWKNKLLPEPPFAAWLTANGLDRSNFNVKKFDQELFGIHEAMAGNGLVFCSTTLTATLVKANVLQQFKTNSVPSHLCYYVPNKDSFDTRNATRFLRWVEALLVQ